MTCLDAVHDSSACRLRRWAAPMALVLVCGCCCSWIVSPDRTDVGPRLYADPGVQVERPSRGGLDYRKGMLLQTGDVIQTVDGYAVIDFPRGNVVILRPQTRIALGSILLYFGEIFARIVEITKAGPELPIVTDNLVASVETTEFAVRRPMVPGSANPAGSTAVIVRAGQVRCAPRASGAWSDVLVGPNRILRVEGIRAPRPPVFIDAPAETRWADDAEERLLKGRNATGSPPNTLPPPPQPPLKLGRDGGWDVIGNSGIPPSNIRRPHRPSEVRPPAIWPDQHLDLETASTLHRGLPLRQSPRARPAISTGRGTRLPRSDALRHRSRRHRAIPALGAWKAT
jgi:hypothetical protein